MNRPIALPSPTPFRGPARAAMLGLGAWLAVALGVALSGVITVDRRIAIPLVLVTLVAMQVVLYRRGGAWRALADSLDDRTVVLLHVVRAPIGALFLVLLTHGLDATFARIAGFGDLVSGLGALAVGLFFLRSRAALLVWNTFGLLDLLVVVFTAQRILIFSDHPETMTMLLGFPGMLLPTFLVPIILASHFLLFARLRRAARSESA